MDLDRLDLNLLRVFEALMAERHVTRAAARLGLTQSAASNALGRLRAAFKDDLFQRTPTGMEPTALARELAGPVGAALDAMRAAVALNRPFDPARAEESFTLGMSDYAEFVLAPPLIAALRARAPGVSVVVRHVDREVVTVLLDEDRVHLAIGQLPEPPTRMTRIMLLRDELAVLMRPDHPAAKEGLDLGAFLAWPHLLVSAVASLAAHKPFFTGKVSEALLEIYLSKGSADESALTAREKAVVQLIAEGKTNKQIANILSISTKTVETHRALALRKLNLDTTAALIRYAIRNKLVEG